MKPQSDCRVRVIDETGYDWWRWSHSQKVKNKELKCELIINNVEVEF